MRQARDTAAEEVLLSRENYIMPQQLRAVSSTPVQYLKYKNSTEDINMIVLAALPGILQLNMPVTDRSVKTLLIHVIRSVSLLLSHIPFMTFERSRVRGHLITAKSSYSILQPLYNLSSRNW